MTEQGFNKWLENQPVEDMIVALKYKYSHEKEWTYSNEILEVDPSGEYIWQNDWNEGQTEVEVIGCIPISEIDVPKFKTEPQFEKCPFDDSIPCEWVCTEWNHCKYKPKDEPQTCDTCRFDDRYGDESICSTCARYYSDSYQPKYEPQTERSE